MKPAVHPAHVVVGALLGVPVGALLGFHLTLPIDPVGWMVLQALLIGGIIGAVLGALTFARWPRVFLYTFVPLAVLLSILLVIVVAT